MDINELKKLSGITAERKRQEIKEGKYFVSGFPNKRGKFKITSVEDNGDGSFDIEMGKNGVTYNPDNTAQPLTFKNHQGMPVSIRQIHASMNPSQLNKGLEEGDLTDIINPIISIDEYKSKVLDDDEGNWEEFGESYSYLRTPVKKRVDEAHPNQQAARYNPDGETYRGSANKMPTLPDDPAIDNSVPIDSIMNMSDDGRISDIIDKDHIDKLKSAIREVLLTLTPREERVIRSRFFHDKTLKEIGDEFSVSKDRIRQIEAKALRKMKNTSRRNKIQGFLS